MELSRDLKADDEGRDAQGKGHSKRDVAGKVKVRDQVSGQDSTMQVADHRWTLRRISMARYRKYFPVSDVQWIQYVASHSIKI